MVKERVTKFLKSELLSPSFDFEKAVNLTSENGYTYSSDVLNEQARGALEHEAGLIELVLDDRTKNPIRAGKPREVQQLHFNNSFEIGDKSIPVATAVGEFLAAQVSQINSLPELKKWFPTQASYQRYPQESGRITPHRDGESQVLLGATFTIFGSAYIMIYQTISDPDNYDRDNLNLIDQFNTRPGGLMLLSGLGLGSGKRVIHEVLPPTNGDRLILNLRMVVKKS